MSGGWNTIESDAGVFTHLLEKLGVKDVQFEELISLEPELLAELSPVYGVIFLFKYPTNQPYREANTPLDGSFDHAAAENIFFASQMIQNACGTQALLSVLLNKDARDATVPRSSAIDVGPHLREFRDFTQAFPPDIRGEALSNTERIRSAHNSFARASPFVDETTRQATDDDDVFHFIAYTPLNGILYELDGLQPAPISHGACSDEDFPVKVVDVLRRRIERYPAGEIRFNLLAMVRDLRKRATELGDRAMLDEQVRRRKEWRWENALRAHNFVGFAGEVTTAVASAKLKQGGDEAFTAWVNEGKARTKARVTARKQQSGAVDEMDVL